MEAHGRGRDQGEGRSPLGPGEDRPVDFPSVLGPAEDDPAVRRVTGLMLRQAGYVVIEAGSGTEALSRFEERRDDIDMMVTDMIMPGMGGAALCEQACRKKPDLKVMFCTGYNEELTEPSNDEVQSRQVIIKPFSRLELLKRIREVLDAP